MIFIYSVIIHKNLNMLKNYLLNNAQNVGKVSFEKKYLFKLCLYKFDLTKNVSAVWLSR